MQYLSQRLATKPSPGRGEGTDAGAISPPQRERILDAVEQLAAERGCAGASIEAIVKAAGVSSVTFYEFFAGKEECFVAAFDRAVDATTDELAHAAAGDPATGGLSWSEQVATGLRALARLVIAQPRRARLCLVEAQTGGPELSEHFDAALDRVAAKLREGRALETAPADLSATHEEATAGALAWLFRERLEAADAEGVEALYPELIDIALAPYLGNG
ncbi:MAG TPA: TetR/AcrR family transcriptional regulator [Solirubrobacterales bacterium]|nr:TetR/AcrR family transcriptional regulator [Solirubrobacterales bacterium]